MNASELSDIVKEVPREAWPIELEWVKSNQPNGCGEFNHTGSYEQIDDDWVELLFIGSMTKWLVAHGYFLIGCRGPGFGVVKDIAHATMWYDTEVAALAAACKAVAGVKP